MKKIGYKIVMWTFILMFTVLGSAVILLPHYVINVLEDFYHQSNAELNIEKLSFNFISHQIIVQGVKVSRKNKKISEIDTLLIKVKPMALLDGLIYIEKINISGANIALIFSDGEWEIAGLKEKSLRSIINLNDETITPLNVEKTSKNFYLAHLKITDSIVTVDNSTVKDTLKIKNINISKFSVQAEKYTGVFDINSTFNEAPIELDFNVKGDLNNYVVHGNLSNVTLKLHDPESYIFSQLPQDLQKIKGQSTLKTQFSLTNKNSRFSLALNKANLSLKKVALIQSNLHIKSSGAELNFEQFNTTVEKGKIIEVTADGSLFASDFSISNTVTDDVLLSFRQANAASFNIADDIQPALTVPLIDFNDVKVAEVVSKEKIDTPLSALIHSQKIVLENLSLSAHMIDIQSVLIEELLANVVLDENQQIKTLQTPFYSATVPDLNANLNQKEEISSVSNFSVNIQQILISDKSIVHIEDQSNTPVIQQTLSIDSFKVINIHNGINNKPTVFDLTARTGAYGRVTTSLVLPNLASPKTFKSSVKLDEIALLRFSTQLHKVLGYRIKSGELDLDLAVEAVEGYSTGQAQLNFRGLKLGELIKTEGGIEESRSLLTLNIALSQITDEKGNLTLNIPFSGVIDNLSLSTISFLTDIIKKALYSAGKSYLIKTFVPYSNVVSVVLEASKHIFKMRFNDLIYPLGQPNVNVEHEKYINEFGRLMLKYPETQIEVCAIITPEDLNKYHENNKTLSVSQAFEHLGLARAEDFIDTIVKQFSVASSRLLFCAPELDTSRKANPKLTFEVSG